MKKLTPFLLSLTLIVSLWLILPAAAQQTAVSSTSTNQITAPDESWRDRAAEKMSPELLHQLQTQPSSQPLTAIVKLKEQADLSRASQLGSLDARRRFVYDTLRQVASDSQRDLVTSLNTRRQSSQQPISYRPYFIFNGLAVTAPADTIWELARRDDVASLSANETFQLFSMTPAINLQSPISNLQSATATPGSNIQQINADDVWNTLGITGAGVLVGSIDSGVQYNHPALVNQYAGNLGNGQFDHDFHWYDAVQAIATPYDDNGHGTHTMGTAVGGDGPGPFSEDIGVAPGAKWISAKAFATDGAGLTADIHAAFEWLLAPCPAGVEPGAASCDPSRAPDLFNNSWGSSRGSDLSFADDVNAMLAAGIWPVFAAGNSGPLPGTVRAPGSFGNTFAVGAVNSGDVVADFSSRGPSPLTDNIKPDISAPGVNVLSSIPGSSYGAFSGTSMATPHVTGLGALLLSADPTLDIATIERVIRATAVDLGEPGPDMDYGAGRIDALKAVERIVNASDLVGTVRDAATQQPLAGAVIRIEGQGLVETAVTDATGHYTIPFLIAGNYTLQATLYGYEPVAVPSVTLVARQTTTQDVDMTALPRHTLAGFVTEAAAPNAPIPNAVITALATPLTPVTTSPSGFYSIELAEGTVTIEVAAFGFATRRVEITITSDTNLNFALDALPPILLVDDDEGRSKIYSPHVEAYYRNALDAGGYHYDYWDLEIDGEPSFDLMRQYPAIVWFGGEFGRIKDITDRTQAEAMMAYLDLGGQLFYVSQSHTFYFGDDSQCDVPRWGGTGPCRFTKEYLGALDWIEDQKAKEGEGVAGNPVSDGLGHYPMIYPPLLADFTDTVTGTANAELALVGLDDQPPGQVNLTSYTHISPTNNFKAMFMAAPLEAWPADGAADLMQRVMDWFGVSGLADGPGFAPSQQTGRAVPGETIRYTVRIKNFSTFADSYTLSLNGGSWPADIWNAGETAVITQIGPIPPQGTAELVVTVTVPDIVAPGAEQRFELLAESQSGQLFSGTATLIAQAQMTYYLRDSDQCDSGVHFAWADATGGDRWDIDGLDSTAAPIAQRIDLPEPFLFYNQSYDHLWVNIYGTVLFGDDDLHDDGAPSGNPPIPNPTILDPNGAIYLAWGNRHRFTGDDVDENTAVYTLHDAANNRFIIEYYRFQNIFGGADTFELILDLESNDITVQYQTMTHTNGTVVGIENEIGSDGILYVDQNQPAANILHSDLAVRFGVGQPPLVWEATLEPAANTATGQPNGHVDYLLTLHSTSSQVDTYRLEVAESNWPVTFWDDKFEQQVEAFGLGPCQSVQFGVRVELPPNSDYVQDTAIVRARSVDNPLLAANARLTTDNAAPAVTLPATLSGGAPSRETVQYQVPIHNSGNITDTYTLTAVGDWPLTVVPTTTVSVPPGGTTTAVLAITIPAATPADATSVTQFTATSVGYPTTSAETAVSTRALPNVAVAWDEAEQAKEGPDNWNVRYLFTLRNWGNLVDRFDLTAVAADWPTTLWNSSFTQQISQSNPLGPDETQLIGVQVHIPTGAAPPELDAILLQATSTLQTDKRGVALAVTAVSNPDPSVTIEPQAQWQQGLSGSTLAYTVAIHNRGATSADYTIDLQDHLWPTTATPTAISGVAPGEKVFVTVNVTIPDEPAPPWDEVTVRVTGAETAVSAQTELISLVGRPPLEHKLFLPLVAKK